LCTGGVGPAASGCCLGMHILLVVALEGEMEPVREM